MRKLIIALVPLLVLLGVGATVTKISLFTEKPNSVPVGSDFMLFQRNNDFVNSSVSQMKVDWFNNPVFSGNGGIQGNWRVDGNLSMGGIAYGNGAGLTNITSSGTNANFTFITNNTLYSTNIDVTIITNVSLVTSNIFTTNITDITLNSTTNILTYITNNTFITTNVTIGAPGGFTNDNLTPFTFMFADKNDAESSFPNGVGVLTNGGAGNGDVAWTMNLKLTEVDVSNFYPTNLFTGLTNVSTLGTDANGLLTVGSSTITNITITNAYIQFLTNNTFVNTNTVIITGKATVKTLIVTNTTFVNDPTNLAATPSTVAYWNSDQTLGQIANGGGLLLNNGSGTMSWIPNLWTNDSASTRLVSPLATLDMTSTNITSTINDDGANPAATGIKYNIAPTAGHQFYTSMYLKQTTTPESYYSNNVELIGIFSLLNATNIFTQGWLYGGGGVDAVSGETSSSSTSGGNAVGVYGFSQSKGWTQAGIAGFSDARVSNQTNYGAMGSVAIDGTSGGVQIGGYFEVANVLPTVSPLQTSSAVIVADSRDSGVDLMHFTTNNGGVLVAKVDGNGVFSGNGSGLTNLTYQYKTNAVTTGILTFGGQAYRTNIAADITINSLVLGPNGAAMYESLVLLATNSDTAVHKITWPSGTFSGGVAAVSWITNGYWTEIDVTHFATLYTNAVTKN